MGYWIESKIGTNYIQTVETNLVQVLTKNSKKVQILNEVLLFFGPSARCF